MRRSAAGFWLLISWTSHRSPMAQGHGNSRMGEFPYTHGATFFLKMGGCWRENPIEWMVFWGTYILGTSVFIPCHSSPPEWISLSLVPEMCLVGLLGFWLSRSRSIAAKAVKVTEPLMTHLASKIHLPKQAFQASPHLPKINRIEVTCFCLGYHLLRLWDLFSFSMGSECAFIYNVKPGFC